MQDGTKAGRTTLFVSHNMAAVEALCQRVLWLEKGRVRRIGPAGEIVREYLSGLDTGEGKARHFVFSEGKKVAFTAAEVAGVVGGAPLQGDDLLVNLGREVRERGLRLQIPVMPTTIEGHQVCTVSNGDYLDEWTLEPGRYRVQVRLKDVRLMPRQHRVALRAMLNWGAEMFDDVPDALSFHIQGRDVPGTGVRQLADRGVTWFPAQFDLTLQNK